MRTLVETGVLVGDRGAYRLAQPLDTAGAGHGAGAAGGAYRPAAAGGQTPAPDRRRDWHGGALAAVAGHCRHARRGVAPRPGAPASRRVPLRDQPVPRARLYLQARPDARGGLRESAAASGDGCSMRRIVEAIEQLAGRPARRPGGTAGAPCPAGGGVGQGAGLLPPGGRQGAGALGQPGGGDVLRAGARWPWRISPSVAPRREQAIDLRLAPASCAQRVGRLCTYPEVLREAEALARPSTTRVGWGRSRSFCHSIAASWATYDQAIAAGQRALAHATASGESGLQALAHYRLGRAYHAQGDYRRAIDCYRQTVAALKGRGATSASAGMPARRGLPGLAGPVPCRAGQFAEGSALGEEGLRIAEAVAHPESLHAGRLGDRSAVPPPRGSVQGAPPARTGRGPLCTRPDLPRLFPMDRRGLGRGVYPGGTQCRRPAAAEAGLERSLGHGRASMSRCSCVVAWARPSCWPAVWRRRTPWPSRPWHSPVRTMNAATRPMPCASWARSPRIAIPRR